MNLASFDIFDTVLLRKCGKPANIFYLLAHRLYPGDEGKRECFVTWRHNAERNASHHTKGRETTIADIYTNNGEENFHEYTRKELIDAEKQIEGENLIANPAIKATIEQCRAGGKEICFISDMYLDSEFLTSVLRREGCLAGKEKVYVSCEEGARKSTGALFDKVRSLLNPAEWEHYGDHPVSDVKRARERGIKAHLVNTAFTESEKELSQTGRRFCYELSCLAGLQRAARITQGNNAYTALAADFVAPAYIPYVRFIFEKAEELGIKRLYFLSRDSYILQKIAEQMQGEFPDIELKYLFVSRKALLLPYMQQPTANKFLAVQDKQTLIGKSTEELLNSLGTTRVELEERYSIRIGYSKITNRHDEEDFLHKIFGEKSDFRHHLQETAKEKRIILNCYFEQEGLFDDVKSAMVDVGWLGTTRLMINSILKEEGRKETHFFYYGVRGDVLGTEHGEFCSYFTAQELSTGLTTLVENYFSASPYPTTIGYTRTNDRIAPIFGQGKEHKENSITIANKMVAANIAREIAAAPQLKGAVREWCLRSTGILEELKYRDIDILPLSEAEIFDGKPFVRKLKAKELANIVLLGGRCTAYDKASVRLTVGYRLFPAVWAICKATGKIRRFLYLKLMR